MPLTAPHLLQLLEAEKGKVRKEFERREAAIEVKKKVCAARWCLLLCYNTPHATRRP